MDKHAVTTVPVHPLLAARWSPRSFDPAADLSDDVVTGLLEAARWAPSANNTQPWRFLVTRRGEAAFDQLLAVLNPGNQAWAHAAGALLLVAAETVDANGRPRPWALYDTGQAVAALSVQASHEGLSVHQMGGFDADAARTRFALPGTLTPLVVVAVGRHDPARELPEPFATRELAPRTREPLASLVLTTPAGVGAPA